MNKLFMLLTCSAGLLSAGAQQVVNLPTSKQLLLPMPGAPQRTNGLPASMAVSPDGRWVVTVNAGYGTLESDYEQSFTVLDTHSGAVHDFPDARTTVNAKQTFFSGLAFSADGTRVFASLASKSDPKGLKTSGSGIASFAFHDGVLTMDKFFKLPMVALAPGRTTLLSADEKSTDAAPYPAALALVPSADGIERLLVAETLSDTVALLNTATGAVERRFDVSVSATVPAAYPIALTVSKDGRRAWVALWNASEVDELDVASGKVVQRLPLLKPASAVAAGSHPCALVLDEAKGLLYVALSNRDAVAALQIGVRGAMSVAGYFDARLPGQMYFGAEPVALALNSDGTRMYAATMGTDTVAVFNTAKLRSMKKAKGMIAAAGFVPAEWMPMSIAVSGGKIYIATDKGHGTGPNGNPQTPSSSTKNKKSFLRTYTYGPTLLYGSLATLDASDVEKNLSASTQVAVASNRVRKDEEKIAFAGGANPIKHVIYIIKENRTYDQILGDLSVDGKKVGNGDPSLTMYGADITPNEHKLALQFGVLDNFFDSAEISGDGHVWSTAAIGTDYLERTWPISYRGSEWGYDYEGQVAEGYPLLQKIADVNEAASGYLWTNLAAHGKSLYHFGEYISSVFCDDKGAAKKVTQPQDGAMSGAMTACAQPTIKPGEKIPEEWGGGTNLWPWAIPRLARNVATKRELEGHFAVEAPDFNLNIPDQIRVNVFVRHLEQWKADRAKGKDTMPSFILMRAGNDHTAGTRVGNGTPKALVADNDLAIGRAVEAVSHSAYWDDTAFFILEDDAQAGGDHVDSHRSIALVVSKYSPHTAAPFVDSNFYTTVSVVHTMESLLGLPPMNMNDAFAPLIGSLFAGKGEQPAYVADVSNRTNGLIYEANKPTAPGAAASAKMDFTHADRADTRTLNLVLWQDAMGDVAPPAMLYRKVKRAKVDDDD